MNEPARLLASSPARAGARDPWVGDYLVVDTILNFALPGEPRWQRVL